jgi:hypothetical protein
MVLTGRGNKAGGKHGREPACAQFSATNGVAVRRRRTLLKSRSILLCRHVGVLRCVKHASNKRRSRKSALNSAPLRQHTASSECGQCRTTESTVRVPPRASTPTMFLDRCRVLSSCLSQRVPLAPEGFSSLRPLATCCKPFLAPLRVAAWWRFTKLTNGISPVHWRSLERLCDPAAADSRRAGRCRFEFRYRRSLRVRGGSSWLRGGAGIHTATLAVCA